MWNLACNLASPDADQHPPNIAGFTGKYFRSSVERPCAGALTSSFPVGWDKHHGKGSDLLLLDPEVSEVPLVELEGLLGLQQGSCQPASATVVPTCERLKASPWVRVLEAGFSSEDDSTDLARNPGRFTDFPDFAPR